VFEGDTQARLDRHCENRNLKGEPYRLVIDVGIGARKRDLRIGLVEKLMVFRILRDLSREILSVGPKEPNTALIDSAGEEAKGVCDNGSAGREAGPVLYRRPDDLLRVVLLKPKIEPRNHGFYCFRFRGITAEREEE
jgi:hypothetical protein